MPINLHEIHQAFTRIIRSRLVYTTLAVVVAGSYFLAAPQPVTAAPSKKTVAVLYFDYSGESEERTYLRKALAQMLIADLAGTQGITLVERTRLEEVLAELDLSRTKRIDRKTALRVGKLLGAHYLVFGGYFFDDKGRIYVNGRVAHVETGEIIAGVHNRREGGDFWALEQYLAGELRSILQNRVVAHADKRERVQRVAAKRKARRARKARAVAKAKAKVDKSSTSGSATPSSPPGSGRSPTVQPAGAGTAVKAVGGSAKAADARRLDAGTAARYGRALDAMDRGDRKTARTALTKVVEESPGFRLAAIDLAGLAK